MIYDIQNASMWKRISAWLFDMIVIAIAAVGFAYLISSALGYDNEIQKIEDAKNQYETQYGIDLNLTAEEINSLSDDIKQKYEDAEKAFQDDKEVNFIYQKLISYTFLIVTFGILFSFIIFEFIIPLIFKNGQTLGKKVFGIAVMRRDGVRITPVLLFTRAILGKYTVETMLPVLVFIMLMLNAIGFMGTVVILIIFGGNLISVAATKNRCAIHDVLSQCICVDMQSQLIFNSPEELIEYKKKLHREEAEKKEYM